LRIHAPKACASAIPPRGHEDNFTKQKAPAPAQCRGFSKSYRPTQKCKTVGPNQIVL